MCGRFTHLFTWKQLHRLLSLQGMESAISRRYNVAPTQVAPVVIGDAATGGNTLRQMQWGLIPSWATDRKIGSSLINARGETIATKPAFRFAFAHQRCIVPISGFYEWKPIAGSKIKQPLYITPTDPDDIWLLAGLWESWRTADHPPLETFTILTTAANQAMASIHDRMPVILDPDQAGMWLHHRPAAAGADDPTRNLSITQYPAERMLFTAVSRQVNSPRHDSPECIRPDAPLQRAASDADPGGGKIAATGQEEGGLFD
jgi:putative SOS response-associated peptidase YedK